MKKLLFVLSFASLTIIANAQWQQTSLVGAGISCFAIKGDTIFAGGDSVYFSPNNGNSWTTVNTGLPKRNAVDALVIKGGIVFAGTNGGGVYMSSNNGSSWDSVNTGLPVHAMVFALAISGNNIFAGAYNGGVFLSSNNGNNWTAVNSGLTYTEVWALAIMGNNIFAGIGDGGVYLSKNNGSSWNEANNGVGLITSGVFSFATSGGSIFAGTGDGGVYLSGDTGKAWQAMNMGLPNPFGYIYITALATRDTNIFTGLYKRGVFYNRGFVFDTNEVLWPINGLWHDENYGLPANTDVTSLATNSSYVFAGTDSSGVWRLSLSTVGIKEIHNIGNIAIYPNPAINIITIKALQKSTIDIINIQGQTILQQQIQQGKTDINISGLAKGVYILRLCSNDKTEVTRIVKE